MFHKGGLDLCHFLVTGALQSKADKTLINFSKKIYFFNAENQQQQTCPIRRDFLIIKIYNIYIIKISRQVTQENYKSHPQEGRRIKT